MKIRLHCEMSGTCDSPVTHIGSKGYVYCAAHAIDRRVAGCENTRKMAKWEIAKLQDGGQIGYAQRARESA